MAYVYILKSLKDNKKYIGSTVNLKKRLKQHFEGKVLSTKNRLPLKLMGYQYFEIVQQAAEYEKRYKRSYNLVIRRIKSGKIRLINGV